MHIMPRASLAVSHCLIPLRVGGAGWTGARGGWPRTATREGVTVCQSVLLAGMVGMVPQRQNSPVDSSNRKRCCSPMFFLLLQPSSICPGYRSSARPASNKRRIVLGSFSQ